MNSTRDQEPEIKLAFNWTTTRVLNCLKTAQRHELIHFIEERYTERFFGPINTLRETSGNHRGFGFAIMALCSLLVETMQCYREGLPSSHQTELQKLEKEQGNFEAPESYLLIGPFNVGSGQMFNRFFRDPRNQRFFPEIDGEIFYKKIRCGLLHQAQTVGRWRVIRTGPFWDSENHSINRDEFSNRLELCFKAYLGELSTAEGWESTIWLAVRKKIWWLIQVSERLEG